MTPAWLQPFDADLAELPLFDELGRDFGKLAVMQAHLEAAMTPELDPTDLADLADAGAALLGLEERLVFAWHWELGQPYPATN